MHVLGVAFIICLTLIEVDPCLRVVAHVVMQLRQVAQAVCGLRMRGAQVRLRYVNATFGGQRLMLAHTYSSCTLSCTWERRAVTKLQRSRAGCGADAGLCEEHRHTRGVGSSVSRCGVGEGQE